MTQFLQLHALTFYPPSNLNRDDLGRPKMATVGESQRLRISSQCLKRSWRTSPTFQQALAGHLGVRTRKMASRWVVPKLLDAGIPEKKVTAWAQDIAGAFAKTDKEKKESTDTGQLVHYSPEEQEAIETLVARLVEEKRAPSKAELASLRQKNRAVDIALFGRMLADHSASGCEAAVQVAHAFTVNKAVLEDDFFTAVDDLNKEGDQGAAHMDENWFGSGVFYLYLCINRDLLFNHLGGDEDLTGRALKALAEAVCKVSPQGKQNSFAARSPAGFLLAEKGSSQPRSLALAFMKSLHGENLLGLAVDQLEAQRSKLDAAYETGPQDEYRFYPAQGEGRFSQLIRFVGEA